MTLLNGPGRLGFRPSDRLLALRPFRRQFVDQLGPQVLDQLAHRIRDGFDVLELENFLV
jgi:hypothetical protein